MPDRRESLEDKVATYLVRAERRLSAGAVAEFGPPPDSGEVSEREQVERFSYRDPQVDEAAVWAAFEQQVQQVEQAGLAGPEKKTALQQTEDMLINTIHPFRKETVVRGAATPAERVKLAERLHRAASKQPTVQVVEQPMSALPSVPALPMLPAPGAVPPPGDLPAALQTSPSMVGQGGY